MTTVYLSGPMTGLPDFNRPAFNAAAKRLGALGYTVLNPARHTDGLTWQQYMRLALLDLAKADEICTLPGWENSRGALIETDIATRLGIPINHHDTYGDAK